MSSSEPSPPPHSPAQWLPSRPTSAPATTYPSLAAWQGTARAPLPSSARRLAQPATRRSTPPSVSVSVRRRAPREAPMTATTSSTSTSPRSSLHPPRPQCPPPTSCSTTARSAQCGSPPSSSARRRPHPSPTTPPATRFRRWRQRRHWTSAAVPGAGPCTASPAHCPHSAHTGCRRYLRLLRRKILLIRRHQRHGRRPLPRQPRPRPPLPREGTAGGSS